LQENCTLYKTINIISKKWSLLILLSIYKSKLYKKQYSAIKKDLNIITPKILSARLKELENEKIIKKQIDNTKIPINTYYSLTKSGIELVKIIQSMKKWGLNFKFNNKDCFNFNCKNCNL
jgi:DNA-binding HxlR family transcriptional regulator